MASIQASLAVAKTTPVATATPTAAAPVATATAAAPVDALAANLAAATISTPATAPVATATAAAPAPNGNGTAAAPAAAAPAKTDEEPVAVSFIEGLHPKDAEAQVEKSANAAIYASAKSFEELPLSKELLNGVYAMKFTRPSKIQAESLPIVLSSQRPNLIGQAHHGSGKTASYSLAMLSRVDEKLNAPQAICVVPVRELAIQVYDVLTQLAKYTTIKVRKAIPQEEGGAVSEHVVVGTPGTLINKLKDKKVFDPAQMRIFVADEADQMLSKQGLGDQTLQIKNKMPKTCQLLLFSATFPTHVKKFANVVAPNAVTIHVKREDLSLDAIKQFFVDTKTDANKFQTLVLLYGLLQIGQAIVFVQTVKTAKELTNQLRAAGFGVSMLFGAGMQPKERDAVMKDFRTGKTTVLITTNVLARGIDVLSVTLVVNYDIPLQRNGQPDPETYIHRIGRSGRFGRPGVAINFVHDLPSKTQLAQIAEFFKCPITALDVGDLEGTEKKVREALSGPTHTPVTKVPAQPTAAAPAATATATAAAPAK